MVYDSLTTHGGVLPDDYYDYGDVSSVGAGSIAAGRRPAELSTTAAIPAGQPWAEASLQGLRAALQQFTADRDWGQYHTPRNLLLALVGETGELAECFQWKGEVAAGLPGFTAQERQHIGEELSDVLLYLIRLADACGIDLAAAAADKMRKNAAKYPADRCRGSSAKYTQYAAEQAADGRQAQAEGAEGAAVQEHMAD